MSKTIFQTIGEAIEAGAEDVVKFVEGSGTSAATKTAGSAVIAAAKTGATAAETFVEGLAEDGVAALAPIIPFGLGAALAPIADAGIVALATKLFGKSTAPVASAQAVVAALQAVSPAASAAARSGGVPAGEVGAST